MLILFDLDGVLVNTADIHSTILKKVVKEQVSIDASNQPYLIASDGLRTVDKLQKLQIQYNLSDETINIINRNKIELTINALYNIPQNKDIEEIINFIKSKKILIGIGSNTRRQYLDIILSQLNITVNFTVAGDEVINPKPHPEIFNKIIHFLNKKSSDTIIFEDSDAGIEAAKQTGATVVRIDPNILLRKKDILNII
jgi:HAD superfamily hydrolase (TIGR01509 family)